MKHILKAAALAGAMFATGASAQDMVFTSWGGTTQDAQDKNWAQPFTAAGGPGVVMDGPTDYGKIKAMVEAGATTWDVVDVEFDWAIQAGQQGLLEPLDFNVIDKAALDPRFVSDYAVGSFYYSFVLGYNPANFAGDKPATLADLFDTAKFPGKRTFYKWSAPGVIEAALLADGVAPEALYPLDLDRAFAKLDTIKGDIIWWEGGAQSQQLLASGEAPIGFFWNGRLSALQADGMDVGISWDQNITAADALVVPKGTKNKEAAMRFIDFCLRADRQVAWSVRGYYLPNNVAAIEEVRKSPSGDFLPDLTNGKNVVVNSAWWGENYTAMQKRYAEWMLT